MNLIKKRNGYRLKQQTKQTQKLKQRIIISSAFCILLAMGLFVYFNFSNTPQLYAATTGDYRTLATGGWNNNATWQKYNGTTWLTATAPPSSTNGVITIQTGHTVTVSANATVDQVAISTGGQITLNPGITLTVANSTGTDLDVSGIFKNAGNVTMSTGAAITYQGSGKYQHNYSTTAGTIPTATWSTGATCEIIGYTNNSSPPLGLQAFSNFTWNCPLQSADINLAGGLTTVNGSFTITGTGTKQLLLASATSSLSIAGNYTQTAGILTMASQNNVNYTLNIAGNYAQSGGTFNTVEKDNETGTVNISGNWSHTGGTIAVNKPNSSLQILFSKTGLQTFTASSGTVTGNADFTVKSGSGLVMNNTILKGRNFTLAPGSDLQIGSAAGISGSGLTGNIQVTGTRSFNAAANYTYNGTAAQVTGSGLPAAINNLSINNNSNLTLASSVSVNNVLTLTNGKIITGLLNELGVTNPLPASIIGYSSTSYVIGLLRRTVTGTGTYDFPTGSASFAELSKIALSSATGFTTILSTFTNTNPLTTLLPLAGVAVNGLSIDKMLNYGFWTLTPNSAMTGGTYTVTVKEQGYTPPNAGRSYCLLKRVNVLSPWQSSGVHNSNTQSEVGGVVTAVRSGLTSFSDFGIGYGEYLQFKNPLLISGMDGKENAIYKFPDVCTDVDAWVQILKLIKGATLDDIDHFTAGYDEAWQPYINAAPNDTSSIKWLITFKVAGTSQDTSLPDIAIAAVDVDGDGTYLKEFVEANNIYSYAVSASTNLTVTLKNGSYKATSTIANIADIDTAQHQCIFQINYRNVNNFIYQTGAISTYPAAQIRQNCLYFHYFFNGNVALPVTLLNFSAKIIGSGVDVNWSTASEVNNDYFTVERSVDGKEFTELGKVKGSGTTTTPRAYFLADLEPLSGTTYYRLKQKDYNGKEEIFKMVPVKREADSNPPSSFKIYPNPFQDSFKAELTSDQKQEIAISVITMQGAIVYSQKFETQEGKNTFTYTPRSPLNEGAYIVRFSDNNSILYSQKIVCRKN